MTEPAAWINWFDGWAAPDNKTLDWSKDNNASRSTPLYPQRQPEPEPVAWWRPEYMIEDGWDELGFTDSSGEDIPLYTAPPQREWQSLTDEEIESLRHLIDWTAGWTYVDFAKAIEAKLREKNEIR